MPGLRPAVHQLRADRRDPVYGVKKDGNREPFQRQKLIAGLLRACEKRPVSVQALEAIADRVEVERSRTSPSGR